MRIASYSIVLQRDGEQQTTPSLHTRITYKHGLTDMVHLQFDKIQVGRFAGVVFVPGWREWIRRRVEK